MSEQIKTLAFESGAALVGIASRERLLASPPSADPGYLLPSTQSVLSFAIPFDPQAIRQFLGKTDWRAYNLDKKHNTSQLYRIGDRLVDLLRGKGFEALAVEINNVYRPEPGVTDARDKVALVPDFSHRYAAVAAGLGRLGWSGNLMTPQFGAAVLLGSVLTSARLDVDPLLAKTPCDGCKMCAATCPVGMISKKESVTVTVAGMLEEIGRKRTNSCCWIGCDGFHGLSENGRWSNWSPYRLDAPLPAEDRQVDALCARLRKTDPDADPSAVNIYTNYRAAYFDPDYLFLSVCGHCNMVCGPRRQDRIDYRKLVANAGIVVLRPDGERAVAHDDGAVVELETPFHRRVALLRSDYEVVLRGDVRPQAAQAHSLSDGQVLRRLGRLKPATGCG